MKKFLLPLFIALLFPGRGVTSAQGAPPALTLPGILSEVKTANPALAAARRQLGLLEAEVAINSAYPNPGIELDKAASSGSDGYELKAVQPVPLTRRAGTAGRAKRTAGARNRYPRRRPENLVRPAHSQRAAQFRRDEPQVLYGCP